MGQLREQDQPLHGILHCAGIIRDGFILRKSPSTFASVLALATVSDGFVYLTVQRRASLQRKSRNGLLNITCWRFP